MLGIGGSSTSNAAGVDADPDSGLAGAVPLAIEPDRLTSDGQAQQLLALASELDDPMGLREALGAERSSSTADGQPAPDSAGSLLVVQEASSSLPNGGLEGWLIGGADGSSPQSPRQGLREEGNFQQGVRHGLWKAWRDDGTLRSSGHYAHGLREGTWESFSSSGALLSELHYEGGGRSGDWLAYSETGAILEEGQYSENVASGRWTTYYSGGQIKERGLFVNGLREGHWEFYDDLGLPTLEAGEYRAGIKVQ